MPGSNTVARRPGQVCSSTHPPQAGHRGRAQRWRRRRHTAPTRRRARRDAPWRTSRHPCAYPDRTAPGRQTGALPAEHLHALVQPSRRPFRSTRRACRGAPHRSCTDAWDPSDGRGTRSSVRCGSNARSSVPKSGMRASVQGDALAVAPAASYRHPGRSPCPLYCRAGTAASTLARASGWLST